MTRAEMIAHILANASPYLKSEIAYHLSIECEQDEEEPITWDELSVLFDIEERANTTDRKLVFECRRLLIDIGFYRVMPADEIANTFRTGGGSVWSFKMDRVPYTTDFNVEPWQLGRPGWNTPI